MTMENQSSLTSLPSSSDAAAAESVVRYKGKLYTQVEREASTYRLSTQSPIWELGTEWASSDGSSCWRCDLCNNMITLKKPSTSNAARHLLKIHEMPLKTIKIGSIIISQ